MNRKKDARDELKGPGLRVVVMTAVLGGAIALAGPAGADVTDLTGAGAFGVSVNATDIGLALTRTLFPQVRGGPRRACANGRRCGEVWVAQQRGGIGIQDPTRRFFRGWGVTP
jgi:hypothetical protein